MKNRNQWVELVIFATLLLFTMAACSSSKTPEATEANASSIDDAGQIPQVTLPVSSDPSGLSSVETFTLEGADTTASGLQFLEVEPGDGQTPVVGDIVTMNFVVSLPDGTVFVDSNDRGEPITAIIGREQLLPGWEEGLGLMKAGGKAKMVLPPELAFGEQGFDMIPPNSQIIIDVELLTVEEPPQPTSVDNGDLTSTASGLMYSDLTIGEGTEVLTNTIVTTHYTIWVQADDKNEFLFSSDGTDPLTFTVGGGDIVFPGWEEGMLNMKAGGKRLLVIPPDLAFGEQGANGVPPNSTLVMEVELVELREPTVMTDVADDDYTVTESGLKYYDMVEGEGDSPVTGQTVVVDYTGWLENGLQFDSSIDRGTPFSFVIGEGNVIKGWDEGVASMKVGGKRQLVIPAELGYGETGSGGLIPPGATLIFDVELIEIQP